MNIDEANSFKDNLNRLIDEYTKDCVQDRDIKTLKEVQQILNRAATGLEDDLEDIKIGLLDLRTKLIASLFSYFVTNNHTVYQMLCKDTPLGFSIEVDMPWGEDPESDFVDIIGDQNDPLLDKAFSLFTVEVDMVNSVMGFSPRENI